jgi:hypothetical protein
MMKFTEGKKCAFIFYSCNTCTYPCAVSEGEEEDKYDEEDENEEGGEASGSNNDEAIAFKWEQKSWRKK